MRLNNNVMWKYSSQKLVVPSENLMVTIDCPPQILVVSDNRKGLISNADDAIVFCKNAMTFLVNSLHGLYVITIGRTPNIANDIFRHFKNIYWLKFLFLLLSWLSNLLTCLNIIIRFDTMWINTIALISLPGVYLHTENVIIFSPGCIPVY